MSSSSTTPRSALRTDDVHRAFLISLFDFCRANASPVDGFQQKQENLGPLALTEEVRGPNRRSSDLVTISRCASEPWRQSERQGWSDVANARRLPLHASD